MRFVMLSSIVTLFYCLGILSSSGCLVYRRCRPWRTFSPRLTSPHPPVTTTPRHHHPPVTPPPPPPRHHHPPVTTTPRHHHPPRHPTPPSPHPPPPSPPPPRHHHPRHHHPRHHHPRHPTPPSPHTPVTPHPRHPTPPSPHPPVTPPPRHPNPPTPPLDDQIEISMDVDAAVATISRASLPMLKWRAGSIVGKLKVCVRGQMFVDVARRFPLLVDHLSSSSSSYVVYMIYLFWPMVLVELLNWYCGHF